MGLISMGYGPMNHRAFTKEIKDINPTEIL
jgi:hypothetical protein